MADISDEAVQAAVAAGDHLVNDEWVRDMLAAALPLVEPGSVLANLLERIHDLEEAFESASKCADMAVTRVRKLEDAMRKSLRHMEDCEDRNDRAVVEAWDVLASALDGEE